MAKDSDSATVDVWTSPAILMVSSTVAALLPILPFRIPADQGAAPVTISGELLCSDHALIVAILFAFTFSFSAVLLQSKPRAARVFEISAALSITSAAAVLLHLIFFIRVA